MSSEKSQSGKKDTDKLIAEVRRRRADREKEYREQALRMYPHICARCGREFSGKKLRELTVHHKDHNHDHNPPDGSNWSCCAFIATTTSTRNTWMKNRSEKPGRKGEDQQPLHTSLSPRWRAC